jgi:hypothetical protein
MQRNAILQGGLDGIGLNAEPCVKRVAQQQGARANMTGQRAEDTIFCILKEWGYTVYRQYPACIGIHGGQVYVDFFVTSAPGFPDGLIIESKWQERSGSVDEKLTFLERNIKARFPCPAIVICGGGGAREGMVEWMKNQVDGIKLIGVFSFEEFLTWANKNL